MIELPDHRGLICGFLLRPTFSAQKLEWETLSEAFNIADGYGLESQSNAVFMGGIPGVTRAPESLLVSMEPNLHEHVVVCRLAGNAEGRQKASKALW